MADTVDRTDATPAPDAAVSRAAQRAAIDAEIDGKTLCDVMARNAERHRDDPAFSWKEGGAWRTMTWGQAYERGAALTMGLRALGVGRGDFVAIMARNRPEHVMADSAVVHTGATPVSIYNTLAPEQIAYIAGHCEAKVAIVEDGGFMERWEKIRADLPNLRHVVLISGAEAYADEDWVSSWTEVMAAGQSVLDAPGGREEFERTWRAVKPEDLATLVYTSGTTGPPKGVATTHRNTLWTAASVDRMLNWPSGPELRAISYLPLAHSYERFVSLYFGAWKAGHGYFCPEVLEVFEYMPDVRPFAFAGVPRVWEKLQAGILAALEEEPNERKRKIARAAIEKGKRAASLEREGKAVPLALRLQTALFERLVYSTIRAKIGLDKSVHCVTAAAPISLDTLDFFWGIGLPLYEGYGMTENTAAAVTGTPGMPKTKIGTVGRAIPGSDVAIADDGEVLIRGGNVTAGYYKNDEATAETFDADGWLHTGDIGQLDEDGYLKIVDRKKELIITAGGKNISPANLEALLKQHPLIGQAAAIGDKRKYVGALVVLDAEAAPGWAKANGVAFTDLASFAREPRVVAEVQRAVDDANEKVSNVEAIKRFTILPTEWTVDSEELTPTLKLKRRVIHAKYAEEIDSLYS
jgi:long-chain acyl-CoA synthetase